MATFNNGINRLNNQYLLKNLKQQKAEEKTEQVVEQKVEAQQQVEQPKVSSKDVLAFMENNAVVNTSKAQATEQTAPKQVAEKQEVSRTVEEEKDDENNVIIRTTTITYDDGSKSVITQKMTLNGFNRIIDKLGFSQEVAEYDADGNLVSKKNVIPYPFDQGDGTIFEFNGDQYAVSVVQDDNGNLVGKLQGIGDQSDTVYEVRFDENYQMSSVHRFYQDFDDRGYYAVSLFDENGKSVFNSNNFHLYFESNCEFPSNPEKLAENFYKLIEKFNLPEELLNCDIYNEEFGCFVDSINSSGGDYRSYYVHEEGALYFSIGDITYRITEDERMIEVIEEIYDDEKSKWVFVKTKYVYDDQGRVIKEEKTNIKSLRRTQEETAKINTKEYTYDSNGNVTEKTLDADGNLVKETKKDADGNVIQERTAETDADGNKTITTKNYDSQGRVRKEEVAERDADGNVTVTKTSYRYNSTGVAEKNTTTTNADGSKTVATELFGLDGKPSQKIVEEYDENGNLVNRKQLNIKALGKAEELENSLPDKPVVNAYAGNIKLAANKASSSLASLMNQLKSKLLSCGFTPAEVNKGVQLAMNYYKAMISNIANNPNKANEAVGIEVVTKGSGVAFAFDLKAMLNKVLEFMGY